MSNSQAVKNLGSPNRIIWEYFSSLRDIVAQLDTTEKKEHIPRKVILCVFMSVAIVETFLNVYFRQLLEESACDGCREQTLKELDERTSLERKIKTWPKRFFNKDIDFSRGVGQQFIRLKELRNKLMHFRTSFDAVKTFDGELRGLADLTEYEALNKNTAVEAIQIAEEMIAEIFRLKGASEEQIAHYLHQWTGMVPSV